MGLMFQPRPRNQLVFPYGCAPGYDPSHIAGSSRMRGSWIAGEGGAFFSLLNARPTTKATLNSSPFTIRAPVGIAVDSGLITGYGTNFATWPVTESPTAFTTAVIFTIMRTPGGAGKLFTTNAVNTSGAQSTMHLVTALTVSFTFQGSGFSPGWPALVIGRSYFIAASANSARQYAVCVDLTNGTIQTWTRIAGVTISATQATWGIGGGAELSTSSNCGSAIAACMYSQGQLSLPQLLRWADDPWSFWYPAGPLGYGRSGNILTADASLRMLSALAAAGRSTRVASGIIGVRDGLAGTPRAVQSAAASVGVRTGIAGSGRRVAIASAVIAVQSRLSGAAIAIKQASAALRISASQADTALSAGARAGQIAVALGLAGLGGIVRSASASLGILARLAGAESTEPPPVLRSTPRMLGRRANASLDGTKDNPDFEVEIEE